MCVYMYVRRACLYVRVWHSYNIVFVCFFSKHRLTSVAEIETLPWKEREWGGGGVKEAGRERDRKREREGGDPATNLLLLFTSYITVLPSPLPSPTPALPHPSPTHTHHHHHLPDVYHQTLPSPSFISVLADLCPLPTLWRLGTRASCYADLREVPPHRACFICPF